MEQELSLPIIKKINNLPLFFPTNWQAVIFRNYGIVPIERIAKVLNTSREIVQLEAQRLGISIISYNANWLSKGYVTIIRNNWHLLSYNQITALLDISENKLAFLLKEDDFLDVKLGGFKPFVTEPRYFKLSKEQIYQTKKIREIVEKNFIKYKQLLFSFNIKNTANKARNKQDFKIKNRIIYSYFALYGDSLESDINESYPDYLLKQYADLNINGIWLQGLLYQLSEYPFDKTLSKGYEIRRKNLNILIERCKKYGIKMFIYLNEPRAMNPTFFTEREHLKGAHYEGLYSLCTSNKVVKDYLYNSVKELLLACPELGGIITITMSENLTHCYSKTFNGKSNCPICKDTEAEVVAAEINNIIYKAVRGSKSKAKVIANLWGWDEFLSWDIDKTKRGIDLLDKNIDIMLISENCMEIIKGGISNTIIDYSISNIGPSKRSALLFEYAKQKGHNTFAKVQINNSWECSAVPYIPVFDLIKKHIDNLKKLNIDGLMLSWTLGGYPDGGLDYIKNAYKSGAFDDDSWYLDLFGEQAQRVKQAIGFFSEAFESFPFDLNFLYYGPQNIGCGNLWYIEKTGLNSTMVGYPYDDIELWRGKYSIEVFIKQLKELCLKWKRGIEVLNTTIANNAFVTEIKAISNACYAHFYSSYLLCEFILNRDSYKNAQSETVREYILSIIKEEKENTLMLYTAQSQNSYIGFEASNHYYYNENAFLEKLVNLNEIESYFLKQQN